MISCRPTCGCRKLDSQNKSHCFHQFREHSTCTGERSDCSGETIRILICSNEYERWWWWWRRWVTVVVEGQHGHNNQSQVSTASVSLSSYRLLLLLVSDQWRAAPDCSRSARRSDQVHAVASAVDVLPRRGFGPSANCSPAAITSYSHSHPPFHSPYNLQWAGTWKVPLPIRRSWAPFNVRFIGPTRVWTLKRAYDRFIRFAQLSRVPNTDAQAQARVTVTCVPEVLIYAARMLNTFCIAHCKFNFLLIIQPMGPNLPMLLCKVCAMLAPIPLPSRLPSVFDCQTCSYQCKSSLTVNGSYLYTYYYYYYYY